MFNPNLIWTFLGDNDIFGTLTKQIYIPWHPELWDQQHEISIVILENTTNNDTKTCRTLTLFMKNYYDTTWNTCTILFYVVVFTRHWLWHITGPDANSSGITLMQTFGTDAHRRKRYWEKEMKPQILQTVHIIHVFTKCEDTSGCKLDVLKTSSHVRKPNKLTILGSN